jgi:hypothetical protein
MHEKHGLDFILNIKPEHRSNKKIEKHPPVKEVNHNGA